MRKQILLKRQGYPHRATRCCQPIRATRGETSVDAFIAPRREESDE